MLLIQKSFSWEKELQVALRAHDICSSAAAQRVFRKSAAVVHNDHLIRKLGDVDIIAFGCLSREVLKTIRALVIVGCSIQSLGSVQARLA